MIHIQNQMTVSVRDDGRPVSLLNNNDLPVQVERNRRTRKLLGSKASNVLFVNVLLGGKLVRIEQSALLVRSFIPMSVDERSALRLAEQLITNAVQFRKIDPDFTANQLVYADELLWLTWTGNMRYGGDRVNHGDVRMLKFQRVPSSEILGTWNTYEREL